MAVSKKLHKHAQQFSPSLDVMADVGQRDSAIADGALTFRVFEHVVNTGHAVNVNDGLTNSFSKKSLFHVGSRSKIVSQLDSVYRF